MALSVGSVVRIMEDRQYGDIFFQSGTLGSIVGMVPTMGACLVALGHDSTSRLIPEKVLHLVASPKAVPKGSEAAGMKFGQGERVKLLAERSYGDVVYAKGSKGNVHEVLPTLMSYLIDFDADSTDRIVPESVLGPA